MLLIIAEGFFKGNISEVLSQKYRIVSNLGKGVFSTVKKKEKEKETFILFH